MKQEMRVFVSLLIAVLFGIIANATSSGVKTNGHYSGIVMVAILVFFIVLWLLGKVESSGSLEEVREEKTIVKKIKSDLDEYHELKKSFKYFSEESLLNLHDNLKSENIENLERLALEEELVERGLIKSSPMHEKLYHLKKHFK